MHMSIHVSLHLYLHGQDLPLISRDMLEYFLSWDSYYAFFLCWDSYYAFFSYTGIATMPFLPTTRT